MINIIYMAKETYSSIKSLEYLIEQDVKIMAAVIRKNDSTLREICEKNSIYMCQEEELQDARFQECDYIISYYWKKIKPETLSVSKVGNLNFHPGPLPEARGSGYHIAILENWKYWGVTAHYMDEEYDTGDIIECRHFEIDNNILNYELVRMTHVKLYELFMDVIKNIIDGKILQANEQGKGNYYSINNIEEEKLINDTDTDDDIERKIRAFFNPPYRGAQIVINGKAYTVVNDEILRKMANYIKRM